MSDWDSVTVLRKRQPKASAMKTEGAINQVCRIFDAFDLNARTFVLRRRQIERHR